MTTHGAYTYETLSTIPWPRYETVKRLVFSSLERSKKGTSDG